MKSSLLFGFSLILLALAVACSGVSSGNQTTPSTQDQAGGNLDQPDQTPESGQVPDEGNNPDPAAVEWLLSFKVSKVLELEQSEGQPEAQSSIEQRLQGSTWEFSDDGTFTYDTTRGVSTLYPVEGEYEFEDNVLTFSGKRTHSYGTVGDSSVSVEGKIDLNVDAPVASVTVEEKATASTDDYGGTFSTNKNSKYSSELLLEPVR
jgi:hypothetical protein